MITGSEDTQTRLGLSEAIDHGPPLWLAQANAWRITRYADCVASLRHPDIEVVDIADELRALSQRRGVPLAGLTALLGGILFSRRPPFHTKARAYLGRAYAMTVATLPADIVVECATALLRDVADRGPADLMAVCSALPLQVMAKGLGLHKSAADQLDRANRHMLAVWRPGIDQAALLALEQEARGAVEALFCTFNEMRREGTGALREILSLGTEGYGFNDTELAGLVVFLVLAGSESTAGLLGNLIVVNQRLAVDLTEPGSHRHIVNEALRFLGPIRRASRRRTRRTLEIGGRRLPRGSAVIVDLEAGNHDPEAYVDPWRFNAHRTGPTLLSFGAGLHGCFGAPTARATAVAFLQALSRYAVTPASDAPPRWIGHPGFRTPAALPSIVTQRASSR